MTQTIGTNANNDMYRGANGNIVLLQGNPAVQAGCKSASLASLGEMVLAKNNGIPFFQAVFVGVPNLPAFNSAEIQTLSAVNGVVSVQSFKSAIRKNDLGKSFLGYTATIETQYGLTYEAAAEIPFP